MKTDLLQRIAIEPGRCRGRHCIRGMRIPVPDILDMLAAGTAEEEILRDYPYWSVTIFELRLPMPLPT